MLTLIDLNYARQIVPLISDELFSDIKKTLEEKKKVLIFHNRRGEANALFCKDCSHQIHCPHCDVSMNVHRYPTRHLLCHQCDFTDSLPNACPKCHGTNILEIGTGIQKIESQIQKLFPENAVFRLDSDKKRTEEISDADIENAEILIATELGSTFVTDDLGLVVFILLENSMTIPEYDIEEKVYTQIAYNLKKNVPVIIQTYTPNAPIAKILSEGNYRDFLTKTLTERKLFSYPPYGELAYIWVEDENKERIKDIIYKLANKLELAKTEEIALHYDKTLFERRAGKYRQKIVLRGRDVGLLLQNIKTEVFRNRWVRLEWK